MLLFREQPVLMVPIEKKKGEVARVDLGGTQRLLVRIARTIVGGRQVSRGVDGITPVDLSIWYEGTLSTWLLGSSNRLEPQAPPPHKSYVLKSKASKTKARIPAQEFRSLVARHA